MCRSMFLLSSEYKNITLYSVLTALAPRNDILKFVALTWNTLYCVSACRTQQVSLEIEAKDALIADGSS